MIHEANVYKQYMFYLFVISLIVTRCKVLVFFPSCIDSLMSLNLVIQRIQVQSPFSRWRCVHSRSWEMEPLSTTPGSPLSPLTTWGDLLTGPGNHWHGHTTCLLLEARVNRTVLFKSHFMYSFLAVLSLRCHAGFSLAVASRAAL